MDRRKFIAMTAVASATPGLVAAAPTSAKQLETQLRASFEGAPLRFHAHKNRIYVVATQLGNDIETRWRVGGSWFLDLETREWEQKIPWVSEGTKAGSAHIVEEARQKALTYL